jgi:hypothetical protein
MTSNGTPPVQLKPASLYAKLAKITGRIQRIKKDNFNQHFKYPYASQDDVYDMIRPLLAEHNITLLVNMISVEQVHPKTTIWFEFTLACGDTGQTHTSHWCAEANDKADKGITKASAFALRYFISRTFLISTGDISDDAEACDTPLTLGASPAANADTASHKSGPHRPAGQPVKAANNKTTARTTPQSAKDTELQVKCNVVSARRAETAGGTKYLSCQTDHRSGALVAVWSRKHFTDAGYAEAQDWQDKSKTYKPTLPIPITIQKDKGFWQLVSVDPAKTTPGDHPVQTASTSSEGWANQNTLIALRQHFEKKVGTSIDTQKFTDLAGISAAHDYETWNNKYPSSDAALEAIEAAHRLKPFVVDENDMHQLPVADIPF